MSVLIVEGILLSPVCAGRRLNYAFSALNRSPNHVLTADVNDGGKIMKKFTMFACLALALVFALSSFAGELPKMTVGSSTGHGGSVNFAKAGLDTINLMAPLSDPTNNSNPLDMGNEPYYLGDFENADGTPNWHGWTHYDITQPLETHWNVSDYNQPIAGNLAAWCGDINIAACNETDPAGGYGNSWHDLIEFRQTVPNTDVSSTVTITATLQHDSEPGYDYSYLSYKYNNQPFGDIQSWDGLGTVAVNNSVGYLPPEYMGGSDIAVYFRFKSDGGWSDEDCSFPSAGGCQVDDINVNIVNGAFNADYFEDFTDNAADDFGLWAVAFPDGVGDYATIWIGLEDNDPCNTNYSASVAFIDDGVVLPTGGSDCINWCYGPGGYIVTTTGGLAGPSEHMHNAIESPAMVWPDHKEAGQPVPDGIDLAFGAYRHEDLDGDSPGIFYTWGVRSADTDGSAGDPQVLEDQGWQDRNFVYYGDPNYVTGGDDVTDLMNQGRDLVQVQLACYELGWIWNYIGNDGYPAPYFDNVVVKIFPYVGPGFSFRELDIANDNFPARGTIDYADLGSHDVRFDAANNIALAADLRNDPGDSSVVDINPVRSGAEFDGMPTMHYTVDFNPVFDAFRTAGMPAVGTSEGMPAVGSSGTWTPGKWAFDLPDTGFLFPGDVLHYYIEATDAIGGTGGVDPQTSRLPADITGYGDFDDPMGYNSSFVVHALPSIRPDGEGGFEHPEILFINDFGDRGGENEWYSAFNNIGLLSRTDYDIYYVGSPSSGVGNGIGGRASSLTLEGYWDILYTSGNLSAYTLSNGDFTNDAGDDVSTVNNWLGQNTGVRGKDLFLTGDDLAVNLSESGTVTLGFLENMMGVTVVVNDIRPLIGSQTTPLVKAIAGNPVWQSELQSWIAYGGCFNINTFDAVNTFGTGTRIAEFTDPSGTGGQYNYSAATLNIIDDEDPGTIDSRVLSMPYDLMYVHTDPSGLPNDLPGRAQLLEDVLMYFGQVGDPLNVSEVPDIRQAFTTKNYPNPFNPSTTIKFNMPKAGQLDLNVYNVRGQLVKTLVDGHRDIGAGQVVWDGTNNQGSNVSSGVYFYEARTNGEVKVQKMALVK